MKNANVQSAVFELKRLLAQVKNTPKFVEISQAQNEVLAKYQPMFAPSNIQNITADDLREFLAFKNNKHWSGLLRRSASAVEDIKRVRKSLAILLDESKPIETRLNLLILAEGKNKIVGLGRAILTAILMIAHPQKYGVVNGTSKSAMETLGIWPRFERGSLFGNRYVVVNNQFLSLANAVGVDLWTLDILWWRVNKPNDGVPKDEETVEGESNGECQSFGLERHLHEFLRDNWEKTGLGREWDLLIEDGELVGYKYSCGPIGEIDLLARRRNDGTWLVIELKRNQCTDDTVGQLQRYMGYVMKELAGKNDGVEGLIISREIDEKLRYALVPTNNIRAMTYVVDFRLDTANLAPLSQKQNSSRSRNAAKLKTR